MNFKNKFSRIMKKDICSLVIILAKQTASFKEILIIIANLLMKKSNKEFLISLVMMKMMNREVRSKIQESSHSHVVMKKVLKIELEIRVIKKRIELNHRSL